MKNDFKTSFTIHFVYILHNCDIYQQLSWVYLSVAGMLIMLHIRSLKFMRTGKCFELYRK